MSPVALLAAATAHSCVGTYDATEDEIDNRVWAGAVRGDEMQVITGGSDGALYIWGDATQVGFPGFHDDNDDSTTHYDTI
eukprot:COSAG05_NODE_87_length_20404_cov_42.272051_13_plen_80_part_00